MNFIFLYIGDVIIPTEIIFFRGVGQPPTSHICGLDSQVPLEKFIFLQMTCHVWCLNHNSSWLNEEVLHHLSRYTNMVFKCFQFQSILIPEFCCLPSRKRTWQWKILHLSRCLSEILRRSTLNGFLTQFSIVFPLKILKCATFHHFCGRRCGAKLPTSEAPSLTRSGARHCLGAETR